MQYPLSRRRFIHLAGKAGGAAAVYRTMAAMGLLAVPEAYAGPPPLPAGSGRGIRVVILGAGIAGMVAAYELRKAGYYCVVLEARPRAGGRNWTVRGGDTVEETDSKQRVAWDTAPHLYFNPGPARLPCHHEGILAYCRELEVPLQVMVNDDGSGLVHDEHAFEGKPQRARDVIDNARGLVAELAAKAVDKGALAAPFTPEDADKVIAFLERFGNLDKNRVHAARGGFDVRALLHPSLWRGPMGTGEHFEPATMLEPVGGMGRIGQAFARALGPIITHNAEVTQIRKTPGGARVVWKDKRTGAPRALDAAYVICTLPPWTIRFLDTDFTREVRSALGAVGVVPGVRIAFQADRRFWELDDHIYGGISWTSRDITQIWYPSDGIHQKKGILVGAYIWSAAIGNAFSDKTPAERITMALASGEQIHPGYSGQVSHGVSVAWRKVPYSMGAWGDWTKAGRKESYPVLLRPDGPILFAGDYLSEMVGWQESAVRSAHHAVAELAKLAAARRA